MTCEHVWTVLTSYPPKPGPCAKCGAANPNAASSWHDERDRLALARYGKGAFDDSERDRLCFTEGFDAALASELVRGTLDKAKAFGDICWQGTVDAVEFSRALREMREALAAYVAATGGEK